MVKRELKQGDVVRLKSWSRRMVVVMPVTSVHYRVIFEEDKKLKQISVPPRALRKCWFGIL